MQKLIGLDAKKIMLGFIVVFWMTTLASAVENPAIKIGVLAKRGPELCLEKWSLTGEYLSHKIPGKKFIILPLDFDQIYSAVEKGEVDFILANPFIYVDLETRFRINRIATLKNKANNAVSTQYGGVIFCKNHRDDIRQLKDLKGKAVITVCRKAFNCFIMAWRELKEAGIDPFKDFSSLDFAGTHDAVVYAVRDGKADAGMVRTDTLERMAFEGRIKLEAFKVLHDHGSTNDHLPFAHSTRPYPEWPMAKLSHTSDSLAEKVTIALLEMPADSRAALASNLAGWTVPLNYQSAHACLKELRIGPYKNYGQITLGHVIKKYWHVLLLFMALILIMTGSIVIFIRLNKLIRQSSKKLSSEMNERKRLFDQVKEKNESLQKAMSEIQTLQGILPICANCKKIRDDKGYWSQIEGYIQNHSQAKFSHGMCPECSDKLYGKEDWYIEMKEADQSKR